MIKFNSIKYIGIIKLISVCLHIFLIPIMTLFYSIFIFDIIGDVAGFAVAFHYFLFMMIIPLLIYCVMSIIVYIENRKIKQKRKSQLDLEAINEINHINTINELNNNNNFISNPMNRDSCINANKKRGSSNDNNNNNDDVNSPMKKI
jgi:hypothetical protein